MKSNEQITSLLQQRKFDGVRYACIDRLALNKIDAQAWLFLGQAMVGLKRGNMAKLCFERSVLLDPFATWIQQAWSDAESVGTGREDKQVLKLLETPNVTVSACILTRDSSRTIRQCIQALQDAVDEIIIVDTGSKDDTVDIVESLGVTVHHFEWIDDFAAARNYAQSLATSDWVIAVDSDEILYPHDLDAIHVAASLFSHDIFVLSILQMNQIGESVTSFAAPRLFQRKHFEWQRVIHEEPTLCGEVPVSVAKSQTVNIHVHHVGYDTQNTDVEGKLERNIQILRRALNENPDDVGYLFYLGRELFSIRQYKESTHALERAFAIALDDPTVFILPLIGETLAQSYMFQGSRERAVHILQRVVEEYPDHPNAWFYYGSLMMESNPGESLRMFKKAKETAIIYRGPLNFDHQIGMWKADAAMQQVNNLLASKRPPERR